MLRRRTSGSKPGQFVVDAYLEGDFELADRIVRVLDTGLTDGDAFAHTCVGVGFLENEALFSPGVQEHVDRWPDAIRREMERRHGGRAA